METQTETREPRGTFVGSADLGAIYREQAKRKEITIPITNEKESNIKSENVKDAEPSKKTDDSVVTDPDEKEQTEEIKKVSPKLQERFGELTARRKEAEALAKAAQERESDITQKLLAIQQERDALKAKYEPPKTELPPKPKRDQFVNDEEFEKSIEDWALEKAEFQHSQKLKEQAERERAETVAKTWKEQVDAAVNDKSMPDFQEVVGKSTVVVSAEAQQAIMEADNGAAILYHLAKNPDIADKIAKMSVPAMNREIGKLSAKMDKSTATQQTTGKTIAETAISKAPKPITPAGGSPDGIVSYDTAKMDYAQYRALRAQGKIK